MYLSTRQEPWVPKRELSRRLSISKRFIEYRLDPSTDNGDVMPSRLMAGKRVFQVSAVESYLREHNYLEEGA